ncbi:MAG TPA: TonB-dependent receptor [Methylophilaceae bacterium]|nr:TonB-dependent receptor [Methylophilaceae bacterium]
MQKQSGVTLSNLLPAASAPFSPLLKSSSLTCLLLALLASTAVQAKEYVDLSLQELGNVEIFSVSKRYEPLAQAPAAAFVITSEDIQRSGATTLQEALRLAPNLQVARSNARNYAISARGFNNIFANKLLVMMDGRVLYTPLFSGVFWDVQDYMLEDIDRIEVISGSAGTLWGANAVDGVINIITKSAAKTQGGLISAGGSKDERYGSARYGGKLENGGHYRVYSKHSEFEDNHNAAGRDLEDGMRRTQAGFRFDWDDDPRNSSTLQGNFYEGSLHQAGTDDIDVAGANMRALFKSVLDNGSNISLRSWLDYTRRDQPNAFRENLTQWDIELRHNIVLAKRHSLSWGGGYRVAFDRIDNDNNFAFLPDENNQDWINLFAQDDIALTQKLRLILGLRMEHNDYTGMEYLPNVRLAWSPSESQMLWASVARSVRAPSRIDRDFYAPPRPPFLISGNTDFESEIARTFELGYRTNLASHATISVTGFYSEYDHLRTLDPGTLPLTFQNNGSGRSHGIETWATWQATRKLKLVGGMVLQDMDVEESSLLQGLNFGANDPSVYGMLRVSYDITPRHLVDAMLRYTSELPNPNVPAYTSMDVRYGWKITRDLEFSLIGQNLLDHSHPEYSSVTGRAEFDRALYAKVQWYFR